MLRFVKNKTCELSKAKMRLGLKRLSSQLAEKRDFDLEKLKQSSGTRITTLGNGMRVASENLEGETATIGVWIDAGSRFEDEKTNGTAHFLEHMAFKGTSRRNQTEIELEIENMGGHLNAYTSREQTAYFAKVFKKDVGKAVDILSDILLNSTLQAGAIEREREVILREKEEVEKQMEEVAFDHLHAVAYQGNSLGRTILGSEENIKTINRSHLTNYIRSNYVGSRMVLAGAGAVNHDELIKLAERAFSGLPSGPNLGLAGTKAKFTGSEVRMRDDTMDNAHMIIAVEGASWTNPDYFPLLVAQAIIGNWNRGVAGGSLSSNRLAQVVSSNSLAQSFMSFNTSYSDTGLFGIYLVSDHIYDLDDLVYQVLQEWVRLSLNVTEIEVARAKLQLKAALLLSLDNTTALCEDIGRQVLVYNHRFSLPQIHALIDAVTVDCVKKVASDYIYDRCPAVVGLGPIGSMPDYNRIRASTLWLRN